MTPPKFHSRYSWASIIKNGSWAYLMSLPFIFLLVLFGRDFRFDLTYLIWNLSLLFIFLVGPLITGIPFNTKELKIENNVVYYKLFFSATWRSIDINSISHINYFNKPRERLSYFPKAQFFIKESKKGVILDFLIDKEDIYRFLSILQESNVDVLLFEELKNINETEFYIPGGFKTKV